MSRKFLEIKRNVIYVEGDRVRDRGTHSILITRADFVTIAN